MCAESRRKRQLGCSAPISTDDFTTNGSHAVLVADVALGPRNSAFLLLGNWVGWLCIGVTIVLVVLAVTGRRTARSSIEKLAHGPAPACGRFICFPSRS